MRYVYCCAGVKLKANSFRQLSKIPGNCFKMREKAVTELPLCFLAVQNGMEIHGMYYHKLKCFDNAAENSN